MILDEYFHRIVIFSLEPGGDRVSHALAELTDKKLSNTAAVVTACRGEEMLPPAWFHAGTGAWGCLQSHFRAIEEAVRERAESLLILEDDCVWLPDAAPRAREFLSEVPDDWGQIYFGGQSRAAFPSEPLGGKAVCLRARSVHRTHAYAVSQRAMSRMLQHILHVPNYIEARLHGKKRHLDHQLEVAHQRGDWPVYVPSYWLAGQAENYSAVRNRAEPERWWQIPPDHAERYAPLLVADRLPTSTEMRKLHFGYNLSPSDPTIDLDIERASSEGALLSAMQIVAEEALAHRRLPAIHPWEAKCEMLRRCWPAGILNLSAVEDLEALAGAITFPRSVLSRPAPAPRFNRLQRDDDASHSDSR